MISMPLSLEQAESLAVMNSSEIIIAQQEILSAEADYTTALRRFYPTLYFTGYIPSITYSNEEINYPQYPAPIDYWKKTYQGIANLDLSLLLITGGNVSVEYQMQKVNEYSNLYQDESYYKGDLKFSVSQPIFGNFSPKNEMDNKKRILQREYRELEMTKKDIIKQVRRYFVDLVILIRAYETLETMTDLAERNLNENEFLYAEGYIDEEGYLRTKGKLGLIILNRMEMEYSIQEYKYRLSILIGIDDFKLMDVEFPSITGDPYPDQIYQLYNIEEDILTYEDRITEKKINSGPSLDIEGYYGLNGKDSSYSALYGIEENRWGVSVGVTIPIFDLTKGSEILSMDYQLASLIENKASLEREIEIERNYLLSRKDELITKYSVAYSTFQASEKVVQRMQVDMLSATEQLNILEDYINSMKYYGGILRDLWVLEVSFGKD